MKEIELSKLEPYYKEKIQNRFKKEHKIFEKVFKMAQKEIAELNNSLKVWNEPKQKKKGTPEVEPLDEKTQKIMERFLEHLIETINEFKIPFIHNDFNYDNAMAFGEHIKRVYQVYNDQGKKSIPKFIKQYAMEIKELELHLRNLGDIGQKVATLLRNNYQEGKTAEALLDRIPKLNTMIDRLGQTKSQIETLDKDFNEEQQNLKDMEENLYTLGQDPALQEYENADREEQRQALAMQDLLKFKKALKKLKAMLDKGFKQTRGISDSDIRPYLKNSTDAIIDQGIKLNALKDLLLKLRILVEDENDPLQLKGELKSKIISNINDIVNENILEPYINQILEYRAKKKEIKKILDERGLETQRNDLKDKIANLTIQVEHDQNDLNRRKREYHELIERVVSEREELQKNLKIQTGEEIKINVIIPE